MTDGVDGVVQVALAARIAARQHFGQLDKLGAAYISHPARVAASLEPSGDLVAVAAGWLHDVIEDTYLGDRRMTATDLLQEGVAPEVVEIVVLMTRTDDVPSDEYYARLAAHPVARQVKLADIADNLLPWRVAKLDDSKREQLAAKYAHAREVLSAGAR
ncbi:HD domain-containing protein [Agromyces sp. SYSU T00194]|uniref:HD domain-containing protein n=1 Tax=Agromyces chitinivorans TaxID=3158560 RepID=UPI0033970A02